MKRIHPHIKWNEKSLSDKRDHPFKMSAFCRGEGSEIYKICQRIVVKKCPQRGVRVKNHENLTTS